MRDMERSEPSLVPQWYKLSNGGTAVASRRSDENGSGLSSRNGLVSDWDRKSSSLKRNLSSNGAVSGKSQAYSSFRGFRDRSQEKSFHSRDREIRYVLTDNGFHDHTDLSLGNRTENNTPRHSLSTMKEREGGALPKKIGSAANNDPISRVGSLSGIGKVFLDRDFPSLMAEGRQGLSDAGGFSSLGPRTALQSLPIGPPVIVGTSALAEVPGKVGFKGPGLPSAVQDATSGHVYTNLNTTNRLNMAEALVQAPSQALSAPQLSVDSQKIEELALKKCKKLIPMTPSMPKAPICTEKTKAKVRGVESSSLNKVGQQSSAVLLNQNHAVRLSARTDTSKPSQAGNLQVLNREKRGNSPTAKDCTNAGDFVGHTNLVPSAPIIPMKTPVFAERKSFSLAQNRNEFFKLLRKKSLDNSNATAEPPCSSSSAPETNSLSEVSASDHSIGNRNCVNGNDDLLGEPETNSYIDPVDDPEEEAFLQSLGWDKNVREEALTEEEIDGFLKKYQIHKASLKIVSPLPNGLNGADQLDFSTSSS